MEAESIKLEANICLPDSERVATAKTVPSSHRGASMQMKQTLHSDVSPMTAFEFTVC